MSSPAPILHAAMDVTTVTALLGALLWHLRRGGSLIFTSAATGALDAAYMEAVQGGSPTRRDAGQLRALLGSVARPRDRVSVTPATNRHLLHGRIDRPD